MPAATLAAPATSRKLPLVALMGNPNTGKSTIFNRLTGMRQRIANYPGITTDAKAGKMSIDGETLEVLDLPGTYSLTASSPDERVVIDVLLGRRGLAKPDLIVCVLDASNLKRNLYLASQLAEFEIPMVLVLNQWDIARKQGVALDPQILEARLGVPVVTTVGAKGQGIDRLCEAMLAVLERPRRMQRIAWRDCVLEATAHLTGELQRLGMELPFPEALRVLFDGSSALKHRLRASDSELRSILDQARSRIRASGLNPSAAEAILHYERIGQILSGAVQTGSATPHRWRGSEWLDALLLNRFWGSIIFFGIMWVVFQSVYAWAAPLMDGIDSLTALAQDKVSPLLTELPILQSLVVDGVIAGAGGVLIFLPQILILFLFIALLEDSGYMARAAFLMDKLFGWCGLNGKSFVPLLSGYACAIPGVMAARSLEDPRARVTTIMLVPFMSCSARLPVYLLLIGAFIEPRYGTWAAGWALFGMHLIGLVVSVPIAWLVNRVFTRTPSLPFILEMPGYRFPTLRNLLLRMWEGGREFLVRAGTVILAISVIIWALLYFPRDPKLAESVTSEFAAQHTGEGRMTRAEFDAALQNGESELAVVLDRQIEGAYIEQSYLGRFGKAVQPAFALAGFDWKTTVGVISSFPAREVVIATMGIIYRLGSDVDEESEGLREQLAKERWPDGPLQGQPVFTLPVVFAIMAFFALCSQCGATVAVIAKQLNWRWAILSFAGMTVLAWLAAVLVYQTGTFLSH